VLKQQVFALQSFALRKVDFRHSVLIPGALSLAAVISFVFPGPFAFCLACCVGAGISIYVAYELVLQPREIRFCWALADGLLLGYALGALNTVIQLWFRGTDPASYFGRPESELASAIAVVLFVAALLFVIGSIAERPTLRFAEIQLNRSAHRSIWLGIILVVIAFATGDLTYMGANVSSERHITPLGDIASLISPILPAVTLFAMKKAGAFRQKCMLAIALVVEIVALVPQGRRIVLYALVLGCIAFNLSKEGRSGSGSKWRKAVILMAACLCLAVSSIFFFAIRFATWQMGTGHNLREYSEKAVDILESGDARMSALLATNVGDRTFILRYFSDLLAASWHKTPMVGEDTAFCVEMAVPSVLFPDKQQALEIGMEEVLANPYFGLPVTDEANSLLTTGVTDFGIVGAVLYPLIMVACILGYVRIVGLFLPPMARLFMCFTFIYNIFQAENALATYIVTFRDLLLVLIVLSMLNRIPTIRLRKDSRTVRPTELAGFGHRASDAHS
jgi:hypothetical protein